MQMREEKSRRQLLAERILTTSERSLTIQVVMILSAFVGLCSMIFPILKSFLFSDTLAYLITTAFTLIVLFVLLAFFFIHPWKVYLVRAVIAVLLVFSLALTGLLYWQYVIKVDDWVIWKDKLSTKVNECEKVYQQQSLIKRSSTNFNGDIAGLSNEYNDKVRCVGEALKEKYPHEGQDDINRVFALSNDARAGTILMENEVVGEVLKTRLGIGDKFLGTGHALPISGQTYGDARLVEYLVSNLGENENNVLAWQISPLPNLSQSVECLIVGCKRESRQGKPILPSNVAGPDDKKYTNMIAHIRNPQNFADDKKVLLIRVNQFNRKNEKGEENYTKRLGRAESSCVFMMRLRDLWNVSLSDAITLSGHQGSGDTLFVWIYAPTTEEAITLATWKNIIPNIAKLLKKA